MVAEHRLEPHAGIEQRLVRALEAIGKVVARRESGGSGEAGGNPYDNARNFGKKVQQPASAPPAQRKPMDLKRLEEWMQIKKRLEQHGMRFSGTSPDGSLVEIVELPNHPWFLAVQYHPEFKSKPTASQPLFAGFIGAAVAHSKAKSSRGGARKPAREESSPNPQRATSVN